MSASDREPIRVLHVDDDPDFTEVTAAFLEREREEFEVRTATSATEGLELLSEEDVDCIVSDYDMPEMNGLEFLETVREDHPKLPFILFTGRGSEDISSEAISAGVTDYLQRQGDPSQYERLANRIIDAIEAREFLWEQYRELFEQAPVMYALTRNRNGEPIIEDCNERFCQILGYPRETLLGDPLAEHYTATSRTELLENDGYERALNAEFISEERQLIARDGTIIQTLLRAVPQVNQNGTVVGTLTLFVDITERKRAEEVLEQAGAMERSERYRRRLYEVTVTAELPADEQVQRVLELGCEYLDMETGFLTRIDAGVQRIVETYGTHEAIQPGSECPLSEAYCRKTIEMDEPLIVRHAAKAGWKGDPAYERFGLEAYVGATLTINGELYGTVCFADRSPRERDFLELELAFVDLLTGGIRGILERHEHEQELEQQNERLEEFAGVISHDLRNPLTVAMGYLEVARETGEDEHFAKIATAHERIEAIIEDVLTLARQGKAVGDIHSVSLPNTVEAAWRTVETGDAELVIGEDLGTIDADKGRLEALFENLFRNAIEHGGRDVTVHVGRSPTGFYIEDDGPGISTDKREQVFDHGHTTSTEGTGFGLAIVATIADAHGWEVTAEEGTDGGARFEVSVPGSVSG